MMRQAFVYVVWSIPARSVCFVCLLSVQCFTADFEKKIHSRKHENNLLETHKKFNFVTSRGQFTGKTWHKIFLKQFLADFKIIRDSIIIIKISPMCQMFIKTVKKHEARRYVGISWNSNQKLACEINFHLPCRFVHLTYYLSWLFLSQCTATCWIKISLETDKGIWKYVHLQVYHSFNNEFFSYQGIQYSIHE